MPKFFFDIDALSKRLGEKIRAAMREPDAKTAIAYTKGERGAIWGGTSMVIGQVVKKTCELHGEQKGRIDGLLSRVEKNAAQMSALHSRIAALERKSAKG